MSTVENPTAHTLTISDDHARYIADIALAAASPDDWTPVITGAHLTIVDGRLDAVATDRYRVHHVAVAMQQGGTIRDGGLILPREALRWIRRNVGIYGRGNRTTVTISTPSAPDQLTLDIRIDLVSKDEERSVSWAGTRVAGNFPDVIRLFPVARDAEPMDSARVRIDFFAKSAALGERGAVPTIKITKAPEEKHRPGPILLTYDTHDGGNGVHIAEALIQPNLPVR